MKQQKLKLLFAHQTKWQKWLSNKFGNEITLLDAIYKTLRFNLLLFFLADKTNQLYRGGLFHHLK